MCKLTAGVGVYEELYRVEVSKQKNFVHIYA